MISKARTKSYWQVQRKRKLGGDPENERTRCLFYPHKALEACKKTPVEEISTKLVSTLSKLDHEGL